MADTLMASTATAPLKDDYRVAPLLTSVRLDREGVNSTKDASALIPNFYQPDYGSKTTSSIYVRGFGSRIDQPAVGLYVDDIPIMNKSNYDFDFLDIRSVQLLRGPQGTLYGRNTSSGALVVRTMLPRDLQGLRLTAEYSPAAAGKLSLSYGGIAMSDRLAYSLTAWGGRYDGDWRFASTTGANAGKKADQSLSTGFRSRTLWQPSDELSIENILSVGYVREGGYAYRQIDDTTKEILPLSYNDQSSYLRFNMTEGVVARGITDKLRWSLVGSWQLLSDRMDLDNDFTDASLFTMSQMQDENAFTLEGLLRRSDSSAAWQPLTGVFAFGKILNLSAPVLFKRDGIDQLILANANVGIGSVFPGAELRIKEQEFLISSDFRIPAYGLAIFHNSRFSLGHWTLAAGLRVDAEATRMDYDSKGIMNFLFSMTMKDWKMLKSSFKGRECQHFVELLPSLELRYDLDPGNVWASVRKGHKAGGFNTQIFSDILQKIMMSDMMAALGVHLQSSGEDSNAGATAYRPESAWDFELGADWNFGKALSLSADAFWIECMDQQVTVLPSGNSTGRMMSNAGHSGSVGCELSANLRSGAFYANAEYGLAIAKFSDYKFSDSVNYAGNYVPYAPRNTVSSVAGVQFFPSRGAFSMLDLSINFKGAGKIFWDEANTLSQPFYALLGANLTARTSNGKMTVTLWAKNLTGEDYMTFWFRSVSRSFCSLGRPFRAGIRLTLNIGHSPVSRGCPTYENQ